MGIYLNPTNESFIEAVNSEIYVDKSELISFTNKKMRTSQKYICVSRPRRFGKSMNLGMLSAYYSKGCDSKELFDSLLIAKNEDYLKHLNKYNVIYINMQDFLSGSESVKNMIELLKQSIITDFEEIFDDIHLHKELGFLYVMNRIYNKTEIPFVILIDEWDCVMREHMNDKESQKIYLDFLRSWLKDKSYVALAYMTGILPIKKYGTHSALNMFREYSMLKSVELNHYIGFTDEEVRMLCEDYQMDFEKMKFWYDGYKLGNLEIYCPNSVVCSITERNFDDYWIETETYEALAKYIAMNFDGLHDTIRELLSGQPQPVVTRTFTNDMVTFESKDDILTLLIHLGYLGYNSDDRTVYIPNKEIADEFVISMEATGLWKETIGAVMQSRKLLEDTLRCDSESVARAIEQVHDSNSSVINYNNEQSLRFIILIAYYYAKEHYDIVQEMPAGKGFADIMFIPKPKTNTEKYPPMVVELKWDYSAETAIRQIKERNYSEKLRSFEKVLLVGISYKKDIKDNKKHECIIEEYKIQKK